MKEGRDGKGAALEIAEFENLPSLVMFDLDYCLWPFWWVRLAPLRLIMTLCIDQLTVWQVSPKQCCQKVGVNVFATLLHFAGVRCTVRGTWRPCTQKVGQCWKL